MPACFNDISTIPDKEFTDAVALVLYIPMDNLYVGLNFDLSKEKGIKHHM
jgi:hypothetical protein